MCQNANCADHANRAEKHRGGDLRKQLMDLISGPNTDDSAHHAYYDGVQRKRTDAEECGDIATDQSAYESANPH